MAFHTADLCDDHPDLVRVMDLPMQSYGRKLTFEGPAHTLKVYEDNALVRAALETPGQGRVLVVDGGGSMRCALLGDGLAQLAVDHDWAGVIVYGAIRDRAAIEAMAVGVRALGTCPLKSIKRGAGVVGEALRFGGVQIEPGAHIYVDLDGIIVASQRLLTPGA